MPPIETILGSLQELTAETLERLLAKRQAEDKALRTLWRAAVAREREERRQAKEAGHAQ
jgi:hypothetical protein